VCSFGNDSEDIVRAWENIKENIKTSATEGLGVYELKQYDPWFNEEYSTLKCRIQTKAI
jgi:hypothetical protein